MVYQHWAAGFVEEVLNGETFKPAGVCSHQAWSESMVLQPLLEGMLGYRADAHTNRLTFRPWFPPQWNSARVRSMKVGTRSVDCTMQKEQNRTVYSFTANKKGPLVIDFQPILPLGTIIEEIRIGKRRIISGKVIRSYIDCPLLEVRMEKTMDVVFIHRGGVGIVPELPALEIGSTSKGLRIISEKYSAGNYMVECEGPPGTSFLLQIVDPDSTIISAENAELIREANALPVLRVTFGGYNISQRKTIMVRLKPS